jgi:hypothetical protein
MKRGSRPAIIEVGDLNPVVRKCERFVTGVSPAAGFAEIPADRTSGASVCYAFFSTIISQGGPENEIFVQVTTMKECNGVSGTSVGRERQAAIMPGGSV